MATFAETQKKANDLFHCLSDKASDAINPYESEYYANLLNQFLPILQSLNRIKTEFDKVDPNT